MSRQLPQVAPQPVRMVSSDTSRQPFAAAWRIWVSVTPLQMHTYKAGFLDETQSAHSAINENQCQMRTVQAELLPPSSRPRAAS